MVFIGEREGLYLSGLKTTIGRGSIIMGHMRWVLLLVSMTVSLACTPLRMQQTPPKVQLDSLRLLPSEGLSQRFEIGLRLTNRASRALNIEGMTFEVALNGHDLLDGVTGDDVTIAGYSETTMKLVASTNLMSTLRFVQQWLNDADHTSLNYALKADIDVKGSLLNIPVTETGEVSLTGLSE